MSEGDQLVESDAARLARLLGAERLRLLADLLEEVGRDTRFGDVKVVVADGRGVGLRMEKSYR